MMKKERIMKSVRDFINNRKQLLYFIMILLLVINSICAVYFVPVFVGLSITVFIASMIVIVSFLEPFVIEFNRTEKDKEVSKNSYLLVAAELEKVPFSELVDKLTIYMHNKESDIIKDGLPEIDSLFIAKDDADLTKVVAINNVIINNIRKENKDK